MTDAGDVQGNCHETYTIRAPAAALSPDRHDSFQITPTPDSLFMPNTKLREIFCGH